MTTSSHFYRLMWLKQNNWITGPGCSAKKPHRCDQFGSRSCLSPIETSWDATDTPRSCVSEQPKKHPRSEIVRDRTGETGTSFCRFLLILFANCFLTCLELNQPTLKTKKPFSMSHGHSVKKMSRPIEVRPVFTLDRPVDVSARGQDADATEHHQGARGSATRRTFYGLFVQGLLWAWVELADLLINAKQ